MLEQVVFIVRIRIEMVNKGPFCTGCHEAVTRRVCHSELQSAFMSKQ
jgi:hypothetical protein